MVKDGRLLSKLGEILEQNSLNAFAMFQRSESILSLDSSWVVALFYCND